MGVSHNNSFFKGYYEPSDPYTNFGYTIPRDILSNILVKRISSIENIQYIHGFTVDNVIYDSSEKAKGVKGELGGRVIEFDADLVFDASGRGSIIAKEHDLFLPLDNLESYAIICQYNDVEVPDPLFSIGTNDKVSPGYYCVFPIDNTRSIVSLIVNKSLYHEINRAPEEWIESFVNDPEYVWAEWFKNATRATNIISFGPIGYEVKKKVINGVLFVGDTTGFFDPLTGEGIGYAIESAKIATDYAEKLLTTNNDTNEIHAEYLDVVYSLKQESIIQLTTLNKLLENPLEWELFITALSKNKEAANWAARSFANMLPEGQRNSDMLMNMLKAEAAALAESKI